MLSNLRFTLNAARSPVNKLPPEVLSRIFACLRTPRTPPRRHPPDNAWEVSNESLATVNLVCRYWRAAIWAQRPKEVGIDDFEIVRVVAEGWTSKVLFVRHKATLDLLALKVVKEEDLLAHQRFLTERSVLKWMTDEGKDPFVVKLRWSFRDHEHLFMALDFHPGGDLAARLARWGKMGHDTARFYAAEIVEGVGGLHKNGIIYRDLQPKNVLIGSDGHIVLTNFGKSWGAKAEAADTYRGTLGYIAPEAFMGRPHSFEVDWWSLGTILYEMSTGNVCPPPLRQEITPADSSMQGPGVPGICFDPGFPQDHSMDQDAKGLILGASIACWLALQPHC